MTATAVPYFSSKIPKLTCSMLNHFIYDPHVPPPFSSYSLSFTTPNRNNFTNPFTFRLTNSRKLRRNPKPPAAAMLFPQYPVLSDICATGISGFVALSVLRVWEETAKRRLFDQLKVEGNIVAGGLIMLAKNPVVSDLFAAVVCCGAIFAFLLLWQETAKRGLDQKLNRKLVHISIGIVFMLCWPLFSSGYRGAILAAITPGVNIIRMLLIGSGIWKDEATVKSMSRYGDYRELLKGPLYYATTITLACALYWRTSPIAIAAICNLCAGDGFADVVGRRFGGQKLPYNRNKSIAGSVAMATAGFFTSIGFMYYFSYFGYIQESWEIVFRFLVVSLASTLVESLPISTELDDNLTVPLTSILVGSLVF